VNARDMAEPPLLAAVRARDVETVRRLLAEGANPLLGDERERPLHAAARLGPPALVEALIAGGALEWQPDAAGRTPLDVARAASPREPEAVIALLDRSAIADRSFREAVGAIHNGDADGLARLIDAEPRLLRERILGPEAYRRAERHQYFLDPKLFWFVANNPNLVERMPANIVEVARVMIERGVDAADLDYTLGLTATSGPAREQGHQLPLLRVLLAAGAKPTRETLLTTAGHRELGALRALVEAGVPLSAPVAAALGENEALSAAVADASAQDVQAAFGLAVINGNVEAARIALDAGADVNAALVVHAHSTALHQAAQDDNAQLITLLLARGARTGVRDTIWNATPLDWANYNGRAVARSLLERV